MKLKKYLKKIDIIQYVYNSTILLLRKIVLLLVYPLKINKNKVIMQMYEGRQYSCNPKYIAEYLRENYNLKIVISLKNTENHKNLKDFTIIKKNSLKYFYHCVTSKIVICNDFFNILLPKRNKQIFINTWHGGGAYKKIGISLTKDKYYMKRYLLIHEADYMISSCAEFSSIAQEAFGNSIDNFLNIGMPRNDLLINSNQDDALKIKAKVKSKYEILSDKKIVLYAPTYRESFKNSFYDLDINMLLDSLHDKFGGDWILMFRGHYFLSDNNKFDGEKFINVSDYDDMQELLYTADVLITDYSSSVWDFSFTHKPCFLYAVDLKEYKKDVDFYYPIEQWPFPLAVSNLELRENIYKFSYSDYVKKVKQHHEELGSYEDGHACEKVCKLINDICDGREVKL